MASVAFILMTAIPTTHLVIGTILIALTLTFATLFVWKLHEAKTLRKEVVELRDTMRMMRYEEANLARMLHIADKSEESNAKQPTYESIENTSESETEKITEKSFLKEAIEDTAKETTEEVVLVETTIVIEEKGTTAEEDVTTISEEEIKISIEKQTQETPENALPVVTTEPEPEPASTFREVSESEERTPIAKSRKQTIKERCPAIPNDLFSAWFEENENTSSSTDSVKTEEENATPSNDPQPTDETISPNEEHVAHETDEDRPDDTLDKESPENKPQEFTTPSTLSKEDERFCRKLERTIHTRMRNPNLNVDIIASQFGLGRTNFYRKVRELTGMSPNDYLRKYRMTKAAELLQTSEMAISDICIQVGIPDAQYFSRVFKVYYGVTPTMYREQ